MVRIGYRPQEMSASGLLETFAGSYGDGEIRALAQEPVQNAKDAGYQDQTVHVEYRLVRRLSKKGMPCVLLTVTTGEQPGFAARLIQSAANC